MNSSTTTPPFPDHARAVARAIRSVFSESISALGADPRDAKSISLRFGLNGNLAWKISKIVQAEDPAQALSQMPGSPGLAIFQRALKKAGATATMLNSLRDALAGYDQLIRIHSGDRATLEIMGSELSSEGRRQRDEYHRKLLFQGASYVWGAQTRVIFKVGLVGPSAEPGGLDFASLSALIDFRRFRPDVRWTMVRRWWCNDDGTRMPTAFPEPIDSVCHGPDQIPLMAEFCSQPPPELRRVDSPLATTFEFPESPVGNTGAQTCVIGTIQRNLPYVRTPTNSLGEHVAMCDTPAELLVADLFFHERFTFAIPPRYALYSELGYSRPYPSGDRGRMRLPNNEPLQDLGTGLQLPATPEVRRYSEMVQAMFSRMGWSPTEFHGFRMRITYPACPTSLVLSYDLPEAP